jgi:hypothetical protein
VYAWWHGKLMPGADAHDLGIDLAFDAEVGCDTRQRVLPEVVLLAVSAERQAVS